MRVKRGTTKKRRHNKVLELTKGYRMTNSKLFRRAKDALMHAGEYNYAHRKKRASQFRTVWIQRINAVCRQEGTKYSLFTANLKAAGVKLDKKILSLLAVNHSGALRQLIKDTAA